MKPIKVNQQNSLWEGYRARRIDLLCRQSLLGPFRLRGKTIYRFMDCANYDTCLDFASSNDWASFSCMGCRKTMSLTAKDGSNDP